MAMNMCVVFNEFMSIPSLVRAIQHTQFRAKSVKNDLKPMNFLKRIFYFETEGVLHMYFQRCNKIPSSNSEIPAPDPLEGIFFSTLP